MKQFFFVFLILCFFSSCGENTVVFNETRALDGFWGSEEELVFDLPPLDSLKTYNLFFNIRNTNDYPFNNMYLIATINFPHGKTVVDTLEYRMAYPDGSWMGSGIGSIRDNKLWYKENVRFTEEGVYKVSLRQAMRNNGEVEGVKKLDGIVDVGVTIEENLNH